MNEHNKFAECDYNTLPWLYIGYTSAILKNKNATDEEKINDLNEAKAHFVERWSELSGCELSL